MNNRIAESVMKTIATLAVALCASLPVVAAQAAEDVIMTPGVDRPVANTPAGGEPAIEMPGAGMPETGMPASGMKVAEKQPVTGQAGASESGEPVIVTVDRARVFRISRPAATVIIGNPSIADATIEDEQTLVLTGRSFGVTNLIVLDAAGDPIIDQTLVVRGHETNTVRIYRRASRETLACAPICEPTLTIGDNSDSFSFANEQIKARNELSSAGTK